MGNSSWVMPLYGDKSGCKSVARATLPSLPHVKARDKFLVSGGQVVDNGVASRFGCVGDQAEGREFSWIHETNKCGTQERRSVLGALGWDIGILDKRFRLRYQSKYSCCRATVLFSAVQRLSHLQQPLKPRVAVSAGACKAERPNICCPRHTPPR